MLIRKSAFILTLATATLALAAGDLGTFEGVDRRRQSGPEGLRRLRFGEGRVSHHRRRRQCLGEDRRVSVPLAQARRESSPCRRRCSSSAPAAWRTARPA